MKTLAEIYTIHSFVLLEPNLKTMKSASGKRHPGEKQSTGEETSRPQQRSEAWGSREKNVHKPLCSDSSPVLMFCQNFVKEFAKKLLNFMEMLLQSNR